MPSLRHLLILCAAALSTLAQVSCNFDGYCVTCAEEDASLVDASAADTGVDIDAGDDAGPPTDACYPTGIEVCDNIDNDCNGLVDDGDLAGVGAPCSSDVGECQSGTTECVAGEIVCSGVLPSLEICDTKDNDCDGTPDDGNPEGGAFCGTDVGECYSGITTCVDGAVICQGNYDGTDESCNGLDDDCDGDYDEDIPAGGSCGPTTDQGLCEYGELVCAGGRMQCVGAVQPQLEQCDALDHDCDGNPLNGFDLDNDPFNCGSCGHVCADEITAPDPQIGLLICSEGACKIAVCADGYWDNNNTVSDGCEYGPCAFESAVDVCNLSDDDCDGDVDEDAVMPTDLCDPDGECADPPNSGNPMDPTCTVDGWVCDYENHPSGGVVSTDGAHHITPEDLCDGKDNDCDVAIDETFGVGNTCDDGDIGACRELGVVECDGAGGTVCDVSDTIHPGDLSETCNGLDDDCNGVIDDGATTGSLQNWVSIGGGVQILAYEASRPDATDTSPGGLQTHLCSEPDRLPWTNVKYGAAASACAAIGARLCTEDEWEQACATPAPSFPLQQDSSSSHVVVIEAELYSANISQGGHSWVADSTSGHSGDGAMRATPDDGTTVSAANAITSSPRLDYQVNFTTTGTHYVWVHGIALDGTTSNWDDMVHVGIDGAIPSTGVDMGWWYPPMEWMWLSANSTGTRRTISVSSTGVHTFSLWMSEDGLVVDKVVLTTSSSYDPGDPFSLGPPYGCGWSYASSCSTYQPSTCNGEDYDAIPGGADDDQMTRTGQLTQCYANWGAGGHAFDLSGNVKEWTQARSAGENPLRGGSYTNTADGLACTNDFTVADNSFFFPNVGFRCCRGP